MAKKILVVVDAQNDFITGALGNKECNVATNVIADEIRSGKYDDDLQGIRMMKTI